MHYINRLEGIKKARRVVKANSNWESSFSILIKTRKPCSCMGCGHQRKWFGKTRQEIKAEMEAREQMQTIEQQT